MKIKQVTDINTDKEKLGEDKIIDREKKRIIRRQKKDDDIKVN